MSGASDLESRLPQSQYVAFPKKLAASFSIQKRARSSIKPIIVQTATKVEPKPEDEYEMIQVPKLGSVLPGTFWLNAFVRDEIMQFLGEIELKEPIGQGSFGTVMRVTAGPHVGALKCVQKSPLDDEQQKELVKVKCEFNAWRSIAGHQNVITLLGFFETSRNWCFLMEFAPLGSLSQHLKDKDGPLSEPQSVRLAGQLAHAIHYLHLMGYLHRDLSCSNVLLFHSRSTARFLDAKLTDFGLSIRAHVSSSRCGSLAYMSPEVLEKIPYGTGADWWSYGIVLYTMFVGKTPLSIFAKQKNVDLAALSRDKRYELAKNVTIHISRKLSSNQRAVLIDLLQDDPLERLGVKGPVNRKGETLEEFEGFRSHPFFRTFNWNRFSEFEQKIQALKRRGASEEDLALPSIAEDLAAGSPKLKFPADRSNIRFFFAMSRGAIAIIGIISKT